MDIKRIGRNPGGDPARSRGSQISVFNWTVYFAASPDCRVRIGEQQCPAAVCRAARS